MRPYEVGEIKSYSFGKTQYGYLQAYRAEEKGLEGHLSRGELQWRYLKAGDAVERSHYQIVWQVSLRKTTGQVMEAASYRRRLRRTRGAVCLTPLPVGIYNPPLFQCNSRESFVA